MHLEHAEHRQLLQERFNAMRLCVKRAISWRCSWIFDVFHRRCRETPNSLMLDERQAATILCQRFHDTPTPPGATSKPYFGWI